MQSNPASVIALYVGGSSVKSGLVKPRGNLHIIHHTPINSQAPKEIIFQDFFNIIQFYFRKEN